MTSQQRADELLAEFRAERERARRDEEWQRDLNVIRKLLERRT